MINEKQAVQAALNYFQSVYPPPHEDLALEEIEPTRDGKFWLVTLGIWKPKPKSPLDKEIEKRGGMVLTLPSAEMLRVYKIVKIDAVTGKGLSIKIRDA